MRYFAPTARFRVPLGLLKCVAIAALLTAIQSGQSAKAQQGSEDAEMRVQQLVRKFLAAEEAFDAKTLATLIDPSYFEVSPAGELDEHDRFLGFYTPDKRVEFPPSTLSDEHIEMFEHRGAAVYSVTISYAMKNPDGTPRSMQIRGTFVAHCIGLDAHGGNAWKLVSASYTPIRPKPKQP